MLDRTILKALARSLMAGEPIVEQLIARATRMLGGPVRGLSTIARRFAKAFPLGTTRPREREVIEVLRRIPSLQRRKLAVRDWMSGAHRMQPVEAAAAWEIPAIETIGALADWLQMTTAELDWFADLRLLTNKSSPQLGHYHYRTLPKRSGQVRLIEAPKPRMKAQQRKILAEILEKIPPHGAVHGFVKARSIKTFADPHVGQRVVLKMDLQDFFPSVSRARIQALFRTIGYPESVADLMGGICTTAAPRDVSPAWVYSRPHLAQGAPTSPALANLSFYRADCRLSGLAKSAGATYTRYADDLAFSGGEEFDRCVERFSIHAAVIAHEEGFAVHHRKTRIMRQSVRQHLTGLVANQRLNVRRSDFDRLKAILTNCMRLGPESQNRDAHPQFRMHLQGKVAFVESIHPARGARLRALFDQIDWKDSPAS